MSLVGVFAQTFLLTFALSAPALAYSEEGQDMFRRGLYEEPFCTEAGGLPAGCGRGLSSEC